MSTSAPALLPWLEAPLAQALHTLRGHAVLIHGARGVGQFELALAVATAWLCESEPADRPEDGRACGHCAGCHLIAARTHPDLMVVVPAVLQEALGWSGAEEGADSDSAKSKAKPSKEIKVDAVRAVVGFAQQTAARGRGKVAVFFPAERMNPTGANTLLKTLEEPPGATRFLLATAAAQRLLPTVRSRCQALPLPLPAPQVATAWLEAHQVTRADVVLAAAGGAPLEALERVKAGIDAAAWLAFARDVLAGRHAALLGWPVPMVVDGLQKLCHDLIVVAVGAEPRYFPDEVLPAGMDVERLTQCARELGDSARHAEHPWSAALAIEALVQRVHGAAQMPRTAGSGAAALATLER